MSVVKVAAGGLPVTLATSGGFPCTEATNGFGIAVTQSPTGGGLAVTGITFGPTIALSASSVLETAAVNTTVGTLSVTPGTTGTPVFTLADSAGGKFNILGTALRTNALLDYETATFHNITVAVSGVTPAVANQTITISVTDVAEPVIALTGTTVNEDAAINTTVGTLSVVNTFTGSPVYTLTDSAGGKFNISGALLRTNAALDYETATTHSVTVAVSGITPAAPNKAFTVVVLDVTESGGAGTWNPADKSAALTLSPDNLTVIGGGNNNYESVRATVSQSTGKRFCKFTVVETTGWEFNGGLQIGFEPASYGLSQALGQTAGVGYACHGIAFHGPLGVYLSDTQPTWTTGAVISMATDLTAKRIWFKVNANGWNNDILANQDPANGIGGFDITTAVDGTTAFFPACCIRSSGADVGEVSIDLSGTGAPAGFLPWGSGAVGTTKNIVTDYGAVGDAQWAQTTLSITTNVLTSATPIWPGVAEDYIGKSIVVGQAGAYGPQGGAPLRSTITGRPSTTTLTLADNCVTPLSSEPNVIVAWGTNNGEGGYPTYVDGPFAAFRTAFQGQSVTLTIPPGNYLISNGNLGGLFDGIRNITVNATGATVCGGAFQLQASCQVIDNLHHARTASVTAGATSVTLSTPSEVSKFTLGTYALMTGLDLQHGGYPTNHSLFEYLLITAIDADTGSPTYGKITFLTPLVNSYLSTWPFYYQGDLNYGGPATLYALNPKFNHTAVINNLTMAHHAQHGLAGMSLTLNNCVFPGLYGPYPTMAMSITLNNCTCSQGHMEVDKLVDAFTMNNCTWGGIGCQSSTTKLMTLDNTDVAFSINGTPNKLVIRNGSSVGALLVPGPVYGHARELEVRDSTIAGFGSETYHGSGHEIRSGDGSGDGIITDMAIEDGVITVPASMRTLGVARWAVPGGRMHVYDPNVGSIGLFQILSVTESGPFGDIVITTNMTLDDWPSRSYGATGLWLLTHSAPSCTFVNVTGCPEVVDLSGQPAGSPLYSRYKRTHSGYVAAGPYWQLYGRVKYIKVDVTTPYVGATGTSTATLDMGNALARDIVWEPVINLKTAGARIFDATAGTYPVNWTGGQTGDGLTSMTETHWATSNFRVLMSAIAAGTGPVFTVEVITDQGF